jgi:hypothetical protein
VCVCASVSMCVSMYLVCVCLCCLDDLGCASLLFSCVSAADRWCGLLELRSVLVLPFAFAVLPSSACGVFVFTCGVFSSACRFLPSCCVTFPSTSRCSHSFSLFPPPFSLFVSRSFSRPVCGIHPTTGPSYLSAFSNHRGVPPGNYSCG